MRDFLKTHKKRISTDAILILAAVIPAIAAFILDYHIVTKDLFVRSGAIMALFAAFLEFKTHEVHTLRERDNFHRLWGIVAALTEGIANVDRAAKHALREMATLIESAGMEPAMGKTSDIKDMVVTERIKALKYLQLVPESYYSYSNAMAIFGKALVVTGTLIWAFGDFLVNFARA